MYLRILTPQSDSPLYQGDFLIDTGNQISIIHTDPMTLNPLLTEGLGGATPLFYPDGVVLCDRTHLMGCG